MRSLSAAGPNNHSQIAECPSSAQATHLTGVQDFVPAREVGAKRGSLATAFTESMLRPLCRGRRAEAWPGPTETRMLLAAKPKGSWD
jgi:hypothetical protein